MNYQALLLLAGMGVALAQLHVVTFQPCRPLTECEMMGYQCYHEHCQDCMDGDVEIAGVPGLCHGQQLCCMGGCPPGWEYFEDYCYKLNTAFLDWFQANDSCAAEDASLASVHSQAEQDFMNGIGTERYWIGLCDKITDALFVWSDGSAYNYNNWHHNQPNDMQPGQDCVESVVARWNDVQCSRTMHSICKKPLNP